MSEEFKINSRRSAITIILYRTEHYFWKKRYCILLRAILLLSYLVKRILDLNAQISYKAEIGHNLKLPHAGNGVVVSEYARIGNNVTIFQQVTIGINEDYGENEKEITIGDGSYIFSGAKIISCKVGNNCKIGANAVCYKNIPDGKKVVSLNQII